MKFISILFLLLLLPNFIFAKESVSVAIDPEYAPLSYRSFEGKPEGLLVEFWKLWGKKSGYDVKFKFYKWDDTLKNVKDGKVIFHSGLTPTEPWMVSSKKIYEIKTSFYKLKNYKLPTKLRIGSIAPYYLKLVGKEFPNSKGIKYTKYMPMIKDILHHKIDMFIDDEIAVNSFLLQKGVKTKFETVGKSFYSDINVVTNKANKKYIDIFNKYFKQISIEEFASIEDDILGKGKGFYNSKAGAFSEMLTKKEKEWLAKKEPVTYVYDPDWPPFEFNNGVNVHSGIVADILKMITEKTGMLFKPINTKTWAESVSLAKNKKVDMYSAVLETKDRKTYMDFTKKYIFKYFGGLVVRKNDNQKYIDFKKDLVGKKIGLTKGNALGTYMRRKYPNLNYIDVTSTSDGFKKLRDHNIDIFVVNIVTGQYYINNKGYSDTKVASKLNFEFGLKIAIAKDKPKEIISILNKAIDIINQKELNSIYHKWVHNIDIITLSDKEDEYIKNQKPIRYVYDPNRAPFEYTNELGKHSGIVADIINLISKKSSLEFQPIVTSSWKESVKLMKNKQADMFSFVVENKDRDKYLNFTDRVLFKIPVVFLTLKNDEHIYENVKFDLKNKKIGIVKGRAIYKKLLEKFPNFHFVECENIDNGLKKVLDHQIDMFAVNKSTAKYYIKILGYNDIKIATSTDVFFKFRIALQKSLPPEILSIMNKTLKVITDEDINEIYNTHVNLEIKQKTDWDLIVKLGAGACFILLLVLWSNRRLKIVVKEKTHELAEFNKSLETKVEDRTRELHEEKYFIDLIINSSQDALVVIDINSKVTTWSSAASKIFGYTDDEMIGNNIEQIIPPKYRKSHFEGINNILAGADPKLLGKGVVEIEGMRKDGKVIPIDLALNKFVINKSVFFSANIRDISERKKLVDKIEAERKFTKTLLNSQEQIIITTDGVSIRNVNQSFLDFFEIESLDKFEYDCICDLFDPNMSSEYLSHHTTNDSWLDYIIDNPSLTHKVQIKMDNKISIFSVTAGELSLKEKLKFAVFTDITPVENAKKEIELIHKHIKESIDYASLIQGALIPNADSFAKVFSDHFTVWQPKDIIGGDIYLFEELRDKDESLLMVIDCTGHGVPGAFVTMLVKAIERQIVARINHSDEIVSPAKILNIFNSSMKHLLKQENKNSVSNAGFDGGIVYYNKKENIIKFAGAETPLFYVKDNELHMIKGDRYSVGYKKCDIEYKYKEHIIELEKGMQFYITTDGYLDQNGGEKGFCFGKKRFQKIILQNHTKVMEEQKEVLLSELAVYQDDEERNDDVTLIGFKV